MLKPMTFTIAISAAILSSGSFAHVSGGALSDGNNNPVSSSYEKCVRVSSGKFFAKCQDIKPREVAEPIVAEPPQPVAVQEKVEKPVSSYAEFLFEFDSAKLSSQAMTSINGMAQSVSGLSRYNISIVGHTDSRGTENYNQILSERRAKAVADYMVSKGVPASSISTVGHGETKPVASNDTKEGRAKNRRAEVTVDGMEVTYKTVYK